MKSRRGWTDFAAMASIQPALFDAAEIAKVQPKRRRTGTAKKPSIPERDLLKQIYDGLKIHPLVGDIERINVMAGRLYGKDGKPSRFLRSCKKGHADLEGHTKNGATKIAIEVKKPSTINRLSDDQRAYLDQVKRDGGLAGVATCYEEAAAIVEGRV